MSPTAHEHRQEQKVPHASTHETVAPPPPPPPPSPPTGPTGGGFGGFGPEDVRQFRREFRERRGELETLRQRMRQEGIDVEALSQVLARLRELDRRRTFDDPAEIARLQAAAIEGLKEFEYALRREVQGPEADRLLLSGSDEVPDGFREMVEEYYRALSNNRR